MKVKPRERSQPTTAPAAAQFSARLRATAERARRAGKPQIVEQGERGRVDCFWRVYPITFDPAAVPRSERYWREREDAGRFLHGTICTWTEGDGRPLQNRLDPHEPDLCEAWVWKFLDKRRAELTGNMQAAAGLLPELAQFHPWRGCVLTREYGRANRRGRPAFKHDCYDLATAYKLAALFNSSPLPRGFFPKLARWLELPWFGLTLSAGELKKASYEIEDVLHTASGVVRNECSAQIQWRDLVMIAVLHTKLPPTAVIQRFPQSWPSG